MRPEIIYGSELVEGRNIVVWIARVRNLGIRSDVQARLIGGLHAPKEIGLRPAQVESIINRSRTHFHALRVSRSDMTIIGKKKGWLSRSLQQQSCGTKRIISARHREAAWSRCLPIREFTSAMSSRKPACFSCRVGREWAVGNLLEHPKVNLRLHSAISSNF